MATHPNFNQMLAMRVFVRVVEAGTFTNAANSLRMPKPTVTKLVQGLETHLRIKLLNRTTRRVSVTPDGSAYYERVVRLLGDLEDIESSVTHAKERPRGRLRIDAGAAVSNILILPALPSFLAKYPEIHVECGVSDHPADLIVENVDCVIRAGPLLEPSLVARHIGDLRWITCATPRYFEKYGRPTHPSDLQSGHVLAGYFFPRSGRMRPLVFQREGKLIEISPSPRVAVNDSSAYFAAVRAGAGIGQLLSFMVSCNHATDEIETVLKDWQPEAMPVHVLYPAKRHLSTKVRVFVDWAADLFAKPLHAFVSIRHMKNLIALVFTLALALATAFAAQAAPPRLEKHGSTQQLVVDGKPFLILGGELGNSSASSAEYMRPHWPRLKAMNLNTVLAPVEWDLIEPVEGKFDWTSVDDLLREARAHDLKLVILWFGAWKNSMSTYVPSWVKRDQKRFPRVQIADGSSVEILSAFSSNTRDADVRAFGAFMEYLKRVDGDKNTVLMVQVENEIGMLPIARERGAVADQLFAGAVPAELMSSLAARGEKLEPELRDRWQKNGRKTAGTWSQVFGEDEWGAEVFTAWHYARFVEALVVAGKQRYNIPLYANVALNRTGRKPGEYPSGGPLPHLIDVWKAGAPSLDFLAPDIYFPNFAQLAARYHRADNMLFIPEANNATNSQGPANAFFAFGELDTLGFSPFSIESLGDAPNALSRAYEVLEQLKPLILENRGKGRIAGFRATIAEGGTVIDAPVKKNLGGIEFTVTFIDPWTPRDKQTTSDHGGMLLYAGGEDFWFAGQGITVTFKGADSAPPLAGIDIAEEGVFDESGVWKPGRRLNGDQTHQGRHIRLPPGQFQIQRVRFYRYR